MFKKLLSNLPFNPSLIGEVSFYAKRMHQETAIRRMGFAFLALAILIQMFAVISPPEPTLAESNNDIVRGGFSTREEAVNHCRSNTQDFANILAYYKITCDRLALATTKTIKSTDEKHQLDSLGRVPQGPVISRTGKNTDEYSAMINGTEYFMRNLWAWDSRASSSYKVLAVTNSAGQEIFVMYNCGNIVTVGVYTPSAKSRPIKKTVTDVCLNIDGTQTKKEDCDVCPNVPEIQTNKNECYPCPEAVDDSTTTVCMELSKTASNETQALENADNTLALPGDTIVYNLKVKNEGTQDVKGFVIQENLSDTLEYADVTNAGGGTLDPDSVMRWPKEDIKAGATVEKKITVRVKTTLPQTPSSASDPTSYDLVMNNVFYGDAVNIKLPQGTTKRVEMAVTSLPNTGAGPAITVGTLLVVAAGYFMARSRLLAKELDIVRADFGATRGM